AAVLGAHGLSLARDAVALTCLGEPPPYYPAMVTLDPDATDAQLARIEAQRAGGADVGSVKDSFSRLDLSGLGFSILFEASWLWRREGNGGREGQEGGRRAPDDWSPIEDTAGLAAWEQAWREAGTPTDRTIFPPTCLDDPGLVFLARRAGTRIEAGCIANVSADSVGLSNVFALREDPHVFEEAADAAGAVRGDRPIVGYESGDRLADAQRAGFCEVGRLRVWIG
ncbi:MAG: hypothetical protein AAF321_12310, partial [Pseudomonadota bacterium]